MREDIRILAILLLIELNCSEYSSLSVKFKRYELELVLSLVVISFSIIEIKQAFRLSASVLISIAIEINCEIEPSIIPGQQGSLSNLFFVHDDRSASCKRVHWRSIDIDIISVVVCRVFCWLSRWKAALISLQCELVIPSNPFARKVDGSPNQGEIAFITFSISRLRLWQA